jgi:hypothetical protein
MLTVSVTVALSLELVVQIPIPHLLVPSLAGVSDSQHIVLRSWCDGTDSLTVLFSDLGFFESARLPQLFWFCDAVALPLLTVRERVITPPVFRLG